jgi:uncharacterized caspase-like protein
MNNGMKSTTNDKEREGLVAVIVGIDGYEKRPLRCAVNDAVYLTETLQKVWKDRKINIKTLIWPSLNQEQTKNQRVTWGIELPKDAGHITGDAILSTVRQCAGLAGESDTFLFYFAGHGVFTQQEPALVTVADAKNGEEFEYIKVKEIQQAAAACASRKKVMILDCCQNSTSKQPPGEGYKNLKKLIRGWSILLSSSPGEISLEDRFFGDSRDDYLQQGVFTASLVEGLRGEAIGSSNLVTLADLAYFVGKRVPIEYQQRILTMPAAKAVKRNQKQTGTRGTGLESQNPVLLSDVVAMGGQYQVVLAPQFVPTSQSERKKWPSKNFLTYWFGFLLGKWPIKFPFKPAFYFAGILYAAIVTLTILTHCLKPIDHTIMLFLLGTAVGSVFVWWVLLPFAVAANEDKWHPGGYVTSFFYLLWHCLVVIGFLLFCDGQYNISGEHNHFIYLIIDLFYILAGVVVFGCNSSQIIIILAETIRPDERREIRQAVCAFQQFKYKRIGVDLYNFIPMVPIRPDLYLYFGIISAAVIVFNTFQVMIAGELETTRWLIFVTRNVFSIMWAAWLVFWYHSAFKFIQREVYKR